MVEAEDVLGQAPVAPGEGVVSTPSGDADALPPTQYLIMEVLAARHRLGEPYWTFPNRVLPAIRALEKADLAWSRSGPVPGHVQVSLDRQGAR